MIKQNKAKFILFCIIIALGVFLRCYNFSSWLEFEIDQTYDTRIVSQAIENGPSSLILLGPTAGGGRALRLGPAFYYLEYLSAKIFGNTPPGHAMLVLILSTLSLPLFYLFSRFYFSMEISLALLALFSGSLYSVLYSRFSWSPNVLPFLMLLSFYALLRSLSQIEKKRDMWFFISVSTLTITTQIHFNAFFTIPAIILPLLLYARPKFKLKTWFFAILLIGIIYSPMIFSDLKTNGENLTFFSKKIFRGGSILNKKTLNFVRCLEYNASNYFLVTTGIDSINSGNIKGFGLQKGPELKWRILAILLICIEIPLLLSSFFKEKDTDKKNFLLLLFLWFAFSFLYFFSLISSTFRIYPRFFLLVSPLAILLVGFILDLVKNKNRLRRGALLFFIVAILLYPNLSGIKKHFNQLGGNASLQKNIAFEDVFPNTKRLTLSEQLAITDYIESQYKKNNFPVYLETQSEYKPAFWYHLNKRGIDYYGESHYESLYAQANYFSIQSSTKNMSDFSGKFILTNTKNFGVLTVYSISPKKEFIISDRQSEESREKLLQVVQIEKLLVWKDLFSSKANTEKY